MTDKFAIELNWSPVSLVGVRTQSYLKSGGAWEHTVLPEVWGCTHTVLPEVWGCTHTVLRLGTRLSPA